jgi:hypothetical protein
LPSSTLSSRKVCQSYNVTTLPAKVDGADWQNRSISMSRPTSAPSCFIPNPTFFQRSGSLLRRTLHHLGLHLPLKAQPNRAKRPSRRKAGWCCHRRARRQLSLRKRLRRSPRRRNLSPKRKSPSSRPLLSPPSRPAHHLGHHDVLLHTPTRKPDHPELASEDNKSSPS